ncbi:unnamed protein product [Alopecurus aequalis]
MLVPSRPATMRSMESSISFTEMRSLPRRPARMAASFMRLARSAPLNPGVRMATTLSDTSGSSLLLALCTLRISSRPRTSGSPTDTCRSKRPGRSSAASRISGRFVAAITMTPLSPLNPSISVSSWFSVCSLSSLPPPMPVPRCRPTASISSMNTRHGALPLALLNRSRTRDAPTPTNISMNSDPDSEKKGTPASPAIALASSVFPVPGGPTSSTPLGILAPTAVNLSGNFRNCTISWKSCFASSTPAMSSKVTPVLGSIWNLALDRPSPNGRFSPPPGAPDDDDRRKSEARKSRGKPKFSRRPRTSRPTSGSTGCAAKSTPFSRSFRTSSAGRPGSCTLTRCALASAGSSTSATATVPFWNRSTFLTAPASRYSRNLE